MKIIEIAKGEIGYLEKKSRKDLEHKTKNAGKNNYTKYGEWYGMNGEPWCAMFVSWCADRAGTGTDVIPKHASCAAGIKWFKERGLWRPRKGYRPKPGDVIYFQNGNDRHVGIVTGASADRVFTIEGNTSGGNTMISNGGGVAAKSYALTYARIFGYGSPEYEEDEDMTGQEIFVKMNEYLKTLEVPEWAEAELREAVEAGITDGSNPCGLIPRYQAAIMAKRAVKK